ncbi:MAG: oligosaccharide flippase family protein [Legionella sp.]|uniref:oligosaccharide flippase family protein n=1 Tax=Legionella sp. TaxID=459 RepID=UPI0039E486B6
MSFKKNLIVNYTSQIYMTLAGVLILPLYLKYMGAEAYGLVGFFTALQSWFNILDFGLSPSISRETARMRAGAINVHDYRALLHALQLLFLLIMILGAGFLLMIAPYVAHSWLNAQQLGVHEIQTAVQLMAVSVGLRWMCSIYRATIIGAEQFVWLGYYTGIFTTLRYLGVLLVLIYVGTTPFIFFFYQILVSFFELAFLAIKAIKNVPICPKNESPKYNLKALISSIKPILPFALSISITSSIWIVITQTDKLILSKLLSLTEYGYFTLGVLAASGVMLFSAPFSMVLMPRMAKMNAENNEQEMLKLYRQATRFVASITIPASLVLALFPEQILWLWTNNLVVSQKTALVLRLYALGNAALAFTTFPYYIQYAHGTMKLHLIGNTCFAALLIPAIIWATSHYGMNGAAWVWFVANISFFSIWSAFIHHRFIKQFHMRWLFIDLLPIVLLSTLSVFALCYCFTLSTNKLNLILQIGFISAMAVSLNLMLIKSRAIINKSA